MGGTQATYFRRWLTNTRSCLANLAMSGKLIWQLYVVSKHPVNRIFRMKYLKGGSLRNISSVNTPTGSAIWNSCIKGFVIFTQQLFRFISNRKRTLLWEDKISGKPPLSFVFQLSELMDWSKNNGLLRLADICTWDNEGFWAGWILPDLPTRFNS